MKWSFCLKENGSGGNLEAVPIAREGLGGCVGRRVRRWEVGVVGSSKTYWGLLVHVVWVGWEMEEYDVWVAWVVWEGRETSSRCRDGVASLGDCTLRCEDEHYLEGVVTGSARFNEQVEMYHAAR